MARAERTDFRLPAPSRDRYAFELGPLKISQENLRKGSRLETPELSSILLGTDDPAHLRDWYSTAFDVEPDEYGWMGFGSFDVLIEARDDVAGRNTEPGRVILNFHTSDARALVDRLQSIGASWLVELEERNDGMFGTLIDPDGNYIQIIQMNDAYLESRRSR